MSEVKPEIPLEILIDTREQTPYNFARWINEGLLTTKRATLPEGDYSIALSEANRVAVERKALDDLIGCLSQGRERFEKELSRLSEYHRAVVVVEAEFRMILGGHYRSRMRVNAVVATLAAFHNRYGVPFFMASNRSGGERFTYEFLVKADREIRKNHD